MMAATPVVKKIRKSLSVENLESRLNLSGLSGLVTQPAIALNAQAVQPYAAVSQLLATSALGPPRHGLTALEDQTPGLSGATASVAAAPGVVGATTVNGNATVNLADAAKLQGMNMGLSNGKETLGGVAYSGAYADYTLNVSTPGTYTLNYDVSSLSYSQMDVALDGSVVTSTTWNSTGAWSNYTTKSTTLNLTSGTHTLRFASPYNSKFNVQNVQLVGGSSTTATTSLTVGSGTTLLPIQNYSNLWGASTGTSNGQPIIGGVKWAGAYAEYAINVSNAGSYRLDLSTSGYGGTADVLLDGNKLASVNLASTGNWSSYNWNGTDLTLSAGQHTLRIASPYGDAFNLQQVRFTQTSSMTTTPSNSTNTISSATSYVPVQSYTSLGGMTPGTSNGQSIVGGVQWSGAYAEYAVNVSSGGTYHVDLSTSGYGGTAFVYVDGAKQAAVSLSSTGNWGSYAWNGADVTLGAGQHTLRIVSPYNDKFNLQQIKFTQGSTTTTTPSNTTTTLGSSTTNVPVTSYSAIGGMNLGTSNSQSVVGGVAYAGAYVEYAVNASSAGSYQLNVATSGYGGTMDVLVNGKKQATINLPSTGNWSSYKTSTATVSLGSGTNKIRLVSTYGAAYNLQQVQLAVPQAPSSDNSSNPPSTPSGSPVTITTNWEQSYNQLEIVGTSGNDSIYVSQSGNTLTVSANGRTTTYNGSYADIAVKGGDGNDTITIDSSVTLDAEIYGQNGNNTLNNYTQGQATIVSIGGGTDSLRGNGRNTQYWAGTEDSVNASSAEKNAGDVHDVSSFYGGVSLALNGQNLSDPSGTGSTTTLSNHGFWGPNPSMGDVRQGSLNDCYVLAAVQSLAISNPAKLQSIGVDLGDGTYAFQFKRNGTTTYVRVDGDLPGSNGNLSYARTGNSGALWAPLFEKAYADFRKGQNSYSSLEWGWSGDVFNDLGLSVSTFMPSMSANDFYNMASAGLASGKAIAISTKTSTSSPIVASHAYSIDKVSKDASGNVQVTLRNPWGIDGGGNDGNTGDGLVTVSWANLSSNFSMGAMAV